jgi:hypothetical protein
MGVSSCPALAVAWRRRFGGLRRDDLALALCAEIDGLFVDLPPRLRERFTLVGCTAGGGLADVLDRLPPEALGTERAWLGDIWHHLR